MRPEDIAAAIIAAYEQGRARGAEFDTLSRQISRIEDCVLDIYHRPGRDDQEAYQRVIDANPILGPARPGRAGAP